MDINVTWHNLYERKLAWAYRGRERFYSLIDDEDIRNLFINSSNEINVCVYGRSQVGKTTLILKLIGIESKYVNYIGNILRGGRAKAQSATIAATIYGVSNDDFFYYVETGEAPKKCTEEELIKILANLRERAYVGIAGLDRVKIDIPKKYFKDEKISMHINIIDLPGIESSDEKEYEHVEKIVKKFVPISNMVILIERADQVAYFKDLKLPGIDYWYEDMDRFKIILTRSVSNGSTQKEIRDCKTLTKHDYVKSFERDLIRDTGLSNVNRNLIYPLEYGESWDMLLKKEKVVANKVEKILEELYNDLIEEIVKSQNPYNKFIMSMKMHNRIVKVIEKKENSILQDILITEELLKEQDKNLKRNEDIIEGNSEEENELVLEINRLEKLRKSNIKLSYNSYDGGEYASSIRSYITNSISSLSDEVVRYISELEEEKIYLNNKFSDISNEESSYILLRLNSYLSDKYHTWISNNFYYDTSSAEAALDSITIKVKEDIKNQKESIIDNKVKSLNERKNNVQYIITNTKKKIEDINNKIKYLNLNIYEKKDELDELKKKSKKDIETSKNFMKCINDSYKEEMIDILKYINSNKTSKEEKLMYLLFMYLISEELSKLEWVMG